MLNIRAIGLGLICIPFGAALAVAQVQQPVVNSLQGPADTNIPAHAAQTTLPVPNSLAGPADTNVPAHSAQTTAPAMQGAPSQPTQNH
jgi:hypothetical protein